MPKWLPALCLLGLACSSPQPTPDVSLTPVALEASASAGPTTSATVVQKVPYWPGASGPGRDVAQILSGMEQCLDHAKAQPDETAAAEGQLARAIAMDACREMLLRIPDAEVNLFTPKERRLLDLAAGGDTALRAHAEEIQQRRRDAWSQQRAELAGRVVREIAPSYRAVDLADSGPPRWRTFARKRLYELAREPGAAAIEEITTLSATKGQNLNFAMPSNRLQRLILSAKTTPR